jgi:hypothetical protein
VRSPVNIAAGQLALPELALLPARDKPLDRTTVNSWEDIESVQVVHATTGMASIALPYLPYLPYLPSLMRGSAEPTPPTATSSAGALRRT